MADDLAALDLAALMCSRVCHDVISPVGAIVNGLEFLDEGGEDMKEMAFDLIRRSAEQASARLQFARLAFGAAGSAGAEIALADAEAVAAAYMRGEKAELSWHAPPMLIGKNHLKLLLNLLLLANAAVPRGGSVEVEVTGESAAPHFTLSAEGPNARVPPAFDRLVPGDLAGIEVDAHAVQGYYTGALARACGMKVAAAHDGGRVEIRARPA